MGACRHAIAPRHAPVAAADACGGSDAHPAGFPSGRAEHAATAGVASAAHRAALDAGAAAVGCTDGSACSVWFRAPRACRATDAVCGADSIGTAIGPGSGATCVPCACATGLAAGCSS